MNDTLIEQVHGYEDNELRHAKTDRNIISQILVLISDCRSALQLPGQNPK